jgi:hypothetical protein
MKGGEGGRGGYAGSEDRIQLAPLCPNGTGPGRSPSGGGGGYGGGGVMQARWEGYAVDVVRERERGQDGGSSGGGERARSGSNAAGSGGGQKNVLSIWSIISEDG